MELTREDEAYVRSTYVPITAEGRRLADRGAAPAPTYVLADGTPMVPADHLAEIGDGETVAATRERFPAAFVAAGGDRADADAEFADWLSGGYGACLWATTPAAIVAKD